MSVFETTCPQCGKPVAAAAPGVVVQCMSCLKMFHAEKVEEATDPDDIEERRVRNLFNAKS